MGGLDQPAGRGCDNPACSVHGPRHGDSERQLTRRTTLNWLAMLEKAFSRFSAVALLRKT